MAHPDADKRACFSEVPFIMSELERNMPSLPAPICLPSLAYGLNSAPLNYLMGIIVSFFLSALTVPLHALCDGQTVCSIHIRGSSFKLSRFLETTVTADQHPDIVRRYIAKKISLGYSVGFPTIPPFPNLVFSSLRVRHEKTEGARLIMDLSRPFGNSVNDYPSKPMILCSTDCFVDHWFRIIASALMATLDSKHAFRIIPVHPAKWHLLILF